MNTFRNKQFKNELNPKFAFYDCRNSCELKSSSEKNFEEDLSLFGQANTASNEMNLLSQQKSVDYFLIIENIANKTYVDKVLKKISEISGVITSFVSENRLENKENLIFS